MSLTTTTHLDQKITKVLDYAGAATATTTTDGVDMLGWEDVVFLTSFGVAAANNLVHLEQGADNSADWTDIANSETGDASSEDIVLGIKSHIGDRYVRVSITTGTSSAVGDVWAIQTRGTVLPVDNETVGTQLVNMLMQPIEGTK